MPPRKSKSRFFVATAAAPLPTAGVEVNQHVPLPTPGAPCPSCTQLLVLRQGRWGPFIGCAGFPKCRYTHPVPGGNERPTLSKRPARVQLTVRLEMETATSVRVWSSAAAAQQEVLRALLQNVHAPLLHNVPRADWATCEHIARATGVYRLSDYNEVLQQLSPCSGDDGHTVSAIPAGTLRYFRSLAVGCLIAADVEGTDASGCIAAAMPSTLVHLGADNAVAASSPDVPSVADGSDSALPTAVAAAYKRIPSSVRDCLLPFQQAGVRTVLGWGGSGLIADEMGLGKTVQAIALLAALQAWPVLLVVPATLRLMCFARFTPRLSKASDRFAFARTPPSRSPLGTPQVGRRA